MDDDDEGWADSGAPSGGRSRPVDCNGNNDGEGEQDTQRGERGTTRIKGTKDGMGKGKGKGKGQWKGKGNSTGKGIVKQTAGGNVISCAIALQQQKEMYEADLDVEG
jgi:hypothetical protein